MGGGGEGTQIRSQSYRFIPVSASTHLPLALPHLYFFSAGGVGVGDGGVMSHKSDVETLNSTKQPTKFSSRTSRSGVVAALSHWKKSRD